MEETKNIEDVEGPYDLGIGAPGLHVPIALSQGEKIACVNPSAFPSHNLSANVAPTHVIRSNPFQYRDTPVPGKVVYGKTEAVTKLFNNVKSYMDTGVICDRPTLTVNSYNQYVEGENFSEGVYAFGQGSFGSVSWIKDRVSGTEAVKKKINRLDTINPDEVLIPLSLNHPAIVNILGCIIRVTGYLEIFMEFGGHSFDRVVKDNPERFEESAITDIGRQGYNVLDVLQQRGIMHLDIKPLNLLLWWNAHVRRFRLTICDFGAAKRVGDQIIPFGWTPGYMAPEQCRYALSQSHEHYRNRWSNNETAVTPQADVNSFARSLLFLLNRQHCIVEIPPGSKGMKLVTQVAMNPAALLNSVNDQWDPRLQKVLIESLCAVPHERVKPLEAFQQLSESLAGLVPVHVNPVVRPEMNSPDRRVIESMEVDDSLPCNTQEDGAAALQTAENHRVSQTNRASPPHGNMPRSLEEDPNQLEGRRDDRPEIFSDRHAVVANYSEVENTNDPEPTSPSPCSPWTADPGGNLPCLEILMDVGD